MLLCQSFHFSLKASSQRTGRNKASNLTPTFSFSHGNSTSGLKFDTNALDLLLPIVPTWTMTQWYKNQKIKVWCLVSPTDTKQDWKRREGDQFPPLQYTLSSRTRSEKNKVINSSTFTMYTQDIYLHQTYCQCVIKAVQTQYLAFTQTPIILFLLYIVLSEFTLL